MGLKLFKLLLTTILFQDPYATDAATALADAYNPELNPYNVETPETALG